MKNNFLKTTFALLGGLTLACSSTSAQVTIGGQSNVTLALTISYTVETSVTSGANTIFTGKLVKESFGNKQLIEAMRVKGDLPDNNAAGWKLVMVNTDPLVEGGTRLFYLVKTGQTPVLVPYLALDDVYVGSAEAYTETVVTATSALLTGKGTYRSKFGLVGSHPVSGAEFITSGVLIGSDKTGPVKFGTSTFQFIYQINSATLSGLIGAIDDSEDPDGDDLLIEGSMKLTAEAPVNIANYPD